MKASTLANGAATRASGAKSLTPGHAGLSPDDLLAAYRTMLLSRKIDDKEIQLRNGGKIFFQISGAGHEAVLVAAAPQLRPGYDWFFPYYRDRALCLALGVTPRDMFLGAVGSSEDPANGGRQMPSHWSSRPLNIPSQSSCVGTHCLHGVGCAEAGLIYSRVEGIESRETRHHPDQVTYISIGEGGTSEGEFWESLNTACTSKAPVLYLVEDNGYAISVPVEVQTPGGDISRLVSSFPGLLVSRCDGTDYLASYRTLQEAIAYIRAGKGPALVHATVTRPYSHSHLRRRALVQAAGRTRGRGAARPASAHAPAARRRGRRHRGRSGRDAGGASNARSTKPPTRRSRRPSPTRRRRRSTSTPPTSIPRRRASGRAARRRCARDDGGARSTRP